MFDSKSARPERFQEWQGERETVIQGGRAVDPSYDPDLRLAHYLGGVTGPITVAREQVLSNTPENTVIWSRRFELPDDGAQCLRKGYIVELAEYFERALDRYPELEEKELPLLGGDISRSFGTLPVLAKTRRIRNPGSNVILPFKANRHWGRHLLRALDDRPFAQKDDRCLWRGNTTGRKRRFPLVERFADSADRGIDVGFSRLSKKRPTEVPPAWRKPYLEVEEMLASKYLISVEGNDVASNLKWILASHSVCLMPPPRRESWLMEGLLEPWVHYVPLARNFSDLEEKYAWCREHQEECVKIARRSRDYMLGFLDLEAEEQLISGILRRFCQRVVLA